MIVVPEYIFFQNSVAHIDGHPCNNHQVCIEKNNDDAAACEEEEGCLIGEITVRNSGKQVHELKLKIQQHVNLMLYIMR